MEQREPKVRILAVVVGGVLALLLFRLWSLQMVHAEKFRILAENNRVRSSPISAPRGLLLDRHGTPLVRNVPVFHVVALPALLETRVEDIERIDALLDLPEGMVESRMAESRRETPVILLEAIPFDRVARVEAGRYEFPELEVRVELGRTYPYGELASHLFGYLGRLRPSQLNDTYYAGVPLDTQVGQWGVERLFDHHLRGRPGRRYFEVNAMGRKTRVLSEEPPAYGEDLVLSIDLRTQDAAERALGRRRGAVVALAPRTGEVLALVSHPGFNPNLFARGISPESWQRLVQDSAHPLFNRALQSRYPPGSTFKVVVAVAALETGVISPDETIHCSGKIKVGEREFRCWEKRGHGAVDLRRAIAESCDVYFYEVGRRVGMAAIAHYAEMFRLDEKPGLGIPQETSGFVPNPDWKKKALGEPWFPGDTINASIGQGYVGTSPFHLALVYASLATGSGVPAPVLVAGEPQEPLPPPTVSPETYRVIQEALLEAVEDPRGTGRKALSPWFHVAGKTGTAQVVEHKELEEPLRAQERDHAWFVGYAPAEEPEVVVSVLVEHGGHGGSAAAPVAVSVLEAYLAPEGPPVPEGQP